MSNHADIADVKRELQNLQAEVARLTVFFEAVEAVLSEEQRAIIRRRIEARMRPPDPIPKARAADTTLDAKAMTTCIQCRKILPLEQTNLTARGAVCQACFAANPA